MNALNTLNNLPENKKQIESFVDVAISELESGSYDAIELALRFKAIETAVKELQKHPKYKELTVAQAEKNGKGFEYSFGHKVEIAETGVKYDYSVCNDSEWQNLNSEVVRITELRKARENWLKTLKEPTPNQQTGELVAPPVKTSTTSLKITLK